MPNKQKKSDRQKKKERDDREREMEISNELENISKQIRDTVNSETSLNYKVQMQRNSTNPRLPYPYNKYGKNKPSLVTANQVRHDPRLYNQFNSGCTACKRRVWDPL